MTLPVTSGLLAHFDASTLGLNDGDPVTSWSSSVGDIIAYPQSKYYSVTLNSTTDAYYITPQPCVDGDMILFPARVPRYVVNSTETSFQISETLGGDPIDLTSNSTTKMNIQKSVNNITYSIKNGRGCVTLSADENSSSSLTLFDSLDNVVTLSTVRTVFVVALQDTTGGTEDEVRTLLATTTETNALLPSSRTNDFQRGYYSSGPTNNIWAIGGTAEPNVYNGTTRLNGSAVADPTDVGFPASQLFQMNVRTLNGAAVNIGTISHGNHYYKWVGDIHEILVYDTVLSDNDVLLVEEYLNAKWVPPDNFSKISGVIFSNIRKIANIDPTLLQKVSGQTVYSN